MDLETEEEKFLEDLLEHVAGTSDNARRSLVNASVPLNAGFQETFPETFGPYSKEEEEIMGQLVDKNILKIKVRDREIHQSLEGNDRSKRKELTKSIGVQEDVIDELIDELGG